MEAIFVTPLPLILGAIAGVLVGVAWTVHARLAGNAEDQASMVVGRVVMPEVQAPGAQAQAPGAQAPAPSEQAPGTTAPAPGAPAPAPGAPAPMAMLANASELPVFSVVAWVVATGGTVPSTGEAWVATIRSAAGPSDGGVVVREQVTPALLPLLPPGSTALDLPAWARSGSAGRPGVELAFTDASGRHWIRRAGGRLERLDVPAWRHYGFTSPDAV